MEKYVEHLEALQGRSKEIMRGLINKAKANPKRIVFPEGDEDKILRAAQVIVDEGIAEPILIGEEAEIRAKIAELKLDLDGITIINPSTSEMREKYTQSFFEMRQRKGVTLAEARRTIERNRNYFGAMMMQQGDADALLSGINHHYPEPIRQALEIVGRQDGLSKVHGMYMMVTKKEAVFFADTTVTIEPTPE